MPVEAGAGARLRGGGESRSYPPPPARTASQQAPFRKWTAAASGRLIPGMWGRRAALALLPVALLAAAARVLRGAGASFAPVVPWLAAAGSLVAGMVLLVSGATPAAADRLHLLRRAVPLPVLEASHLVGSLAGTALLLLARALARRIDAAWAITAALLAAGAAASLAKGLDWEEALVLLLLLGAMLPFHGQFYRKSSLVEGGLSDR